MTVSNTNECFETFFGQELRGVLYGELPLGSPAIAARCKSLIFEDGRALTICTNGSFWVEHKTDVDMALRNLQMRLAKTQGELREALKLAGI